jgi:hypothetical protein
MATNFKAGLPVMFMGASGIGKTDIAHQYAEAQGPDYGLFEINLALASLPDLIGLQHFAKETWPNAEGVMTEIETAKFAYPYFLFDKRNGRPAFTYKKGCIIIEEYGQGQGECKRATGQLVQVGRIGTHNVGAHFDRLLLSNRPEDRSGVSKDFDFLINRRNQMTLKAELDGWLVWAHEHGISNMTMAFAARNEDKVFSNKAPEKQGPWLTPRSLANADAFLKVAHEQEKTPLDDDLVRINLSGIIGEGYAHTYIAFAKIRDQLPSFQSIVADPMNAVLPREPDQMMFLSFDLAAKVKRENIKPVVAYMKRMPNDFAIAFYRSAVHRDQTIRSTKEFGDWAVENLQLLAAVTG